MARAIDADALRAKYKIYNGYDMFSVNTIIFLLDNAPTIDPVKQGKWELKHIGVGHYWECSVCHTNPCIYVTKDTKFCPNCGARMRGEKE